MIDGKIGFVCLFVVLDCICGIELNQVESDCKEWMYEQNLYLASNQAS